jgi:hypothetical protein
MTKQSGKGGYTVEHLRAFLKEIDQQHLLETAVELLTGPEKLIDFVNIKNSNELTWSINYEAYSSTAVSVVTETEFTSGSVIRVSEKTAKAFSMGHVVVVVGNPSSLELMKSFGFQSFESVVDESYDGVTDVSGRFRSLLGEIVTLDESLRRTPDRFFDRIREIRVFNQHHARSGGFLRKYQEVVERPFLDFLDEQLSAPVNG